MRRRSRSSRAHHSACQTMMQTSMTSSEMPSFLSYPSYSGFSSYPSYPSYPSYDANESEMTMCTSDHMFSAVHDMPTAEEMEQELMMEIGEVPFESFLIEEPKAPRRTESLNDIRDSEIEIAYEQMEEAAMMDILADLENDGELREAFLGATCPEPASQETAPATQQLLWNVVATPHMMREFAAHVAASPAIAAV